MALSPAAAELSKELTRVLANVSKRNTRLKREYVKGANLVTERTDAKIKEIRSMPRSNHGEIKSALAQARRLDKSAGTWAKSFQKAAKRAYRDDLVAQASDPNTMVRMTKDQLAEAYSIQRSRLRGRLRSVTSSVGNNFMTRRAEKLLDNNPKNMTLNQLRSISSKTANALNSKTLTVAGANAHIEKGVALVGEDYRTWTDEQRTAFWNKVHQEMELSGLSSTNSIDVVTTAVNDVKYNYKFRTSKTTGELEIILGQSLADVKAKERRAEIDERVGNTILEQGFKKHGVDPLPFMGREEAVELPF